MQFQQGRAGYYIDWSKITTLDLTKAACQKTFIWIILQTAISDSRNNVFCCLDEGRDFYYYSINIDVGAVSRGQCYIGHQIGLVGVNFVPWVTYNIGRNLRSWDKGCWT